MEKPIYKTIITVEVLSEEPYSETSLGQIAYDIMEGGCSGVATAAESVLLTPEESIAATIAQGSDPEFFGLTDVENEGDF